MPIHPFEPGHSGRWTLDAGCSTQPGQHRQAGQAHCLLQRLGCFMLGVMESAPCATFPLYDPPCLPALAPVCYVTIQPWLNALDTGRVCSWSLPHSRHHGGRKGRRRTQDAGCSSSQLSPPSSLFSLLSFSLSLFTLLSPFSLLCPLSPFSSFSFHRRLRAHAHVYLCVPLALLACKWQQRRQQCRQQQCVGVCMHVCFVIAMRFLPCL